MASPGKSPEKNAAAAQRQETGQGSGSGGGNGSPRQQQQTPPPPTRDTVTVSVTGTQTQEGGSLGRRERTEAFGSSSSGAGGDQRRQKRRGELAEVPRGPPSCYVCNKGFQSWKAVFGHMRTHKVGEERARAGAFPPPVFTPPGSPDRELQQQLAPTLLNIAQEVLTRPAARPHIDLNIAQQPSSPSPFAEAEPAAEPPAAEPSSPSTGGHIIDLNRSPKNGGDDGGDNAGAN